MNFSERLDIQTEDEFRDLANSFNVMSDRLGKQRSRRSPRSVMWNRAALSAQDSRQIVDALLQTPSGRRQLRDGVRLHDRSGPERKPAPHYAISRDSREVTVVQTLPGAR